MDQRVLLIDPVSLFVNKHLIEKSNTNCTFSSTKSHLPSKTITQPFGILVIAPKRTKVADKTVAKKTTTKKVVKKVKKAAHRDSASDILRPLRCTPGRLRPREFYRATPSPLELRTADSIEYPSLASYQDPVKKVAKRPRNVIEDPSSEGSSDTSDSSEYQAYPVKAPKRAKTAVKKAPAPEVEDSSSEAASATSEVEPSNIQSLSRDNLRLGSPHRPAKQPMRCKQPCEQPK